MKIAVLLTMVPDLVDELEIDAAGTALETQWLRYVLSESDDHALEQALVLKDRYGAEVTVLALDHGDVDQTLFTALAKGAEEAVKIGPLPRPDPGRREAAAIFAGVLAARSPDLILAGVQAINDCDGHLPGLLGGLLTLPSIGVTRSVDIAASGTVTVLKEYPGGLTAEMTVALPAVIGVLSAPQPPRYVPVARIREVTKSRTLTSAPTPAVSGPPAPTIRRLFKPEPSGRAKMLTGTPDQAAAELVSILENAGVLR